MKLISGFVGALIGGVAGAAIWAAVVKFTGFEIGWVAWGIGALVGLGFRLGAKDLGTPATGVLAAAVALLAVLAGKYTVVYLYTHEYLADHTVSPELASSDEFVLSCVADGVIEEWQSAGRFVQWPNGVDPDAAATESDYPPAAWAEAEARWAAMTPADQQAFRDGVVAFYTTSDPVAEAALSIGAFFASFGFFDLLWIGLAVATAFRMGAASGSARA